MQSRSAYPYIELELQTGRADKDGNEGKASLTDKQALALWDQILASLRPRPTNPAKTSTADPAPNDDNGAAKRLPLGTRVSSAANCPHSGMWQCAPDAPGVIQQLRLIEAGHPMPYGQTPAPKPGFSGLLGLKEDQPMEIVWTLVAYANDFREGSIFADSPALSNA